MPIILGGVVYQTQSMVLAAGVKRQLSGTVRYITVLSATNKDAVSVSFGGASFSPLPPGVAISGFESSEVWVQNTDSVSNTIVVASGGAELRDNRLIIDSLNPVAVSVSAIADGNDVAEGSKADVAATTDTGTFSVIALLKRLLTKFGAFTKSTYTLNSAATTNANVVKATPGNVWGISIINTSAAAKFVRLYDKATAPTVGTDIAYRVIAVAANSSTRVDFANGDSYAAGIGIAITNLIAHNDATAIAANNVQLAITYE